MRRISILGVIAVALACSGAAAAGETAPGQYIVVLEDGTSTDVAAESARALGGEVFARYRHALHGYAARLSPAALAAIRADRRVRFVEEDDAFTAAAQTLPTGVNRIDSELSSTRSGDGADSVDVNVAVIDSGIYAAHPDLNVAGGADCLHGRNGHSFDDEGGHGTHVAGIIGARDNGIGVVGVAPGARLWAVRVLDKDGSGTLSEIACGVDWVTSTRTDADPTNDITVANMSLAGAGSDDGNCGRTNGDALHLAICSSVAAGVTYVVAAANEAADFQNVRPAAYDEALTVTAMLDFDGEPGGLGVGPADGSCGPPPDDRYARFSDFATLVADQAHTIAGPGVCILSTAAPGSVLFPAGDLYGTLTGTSMASPHVAGTAALCIASGACAGLSPTQVIQKLRSDAEKYNSTKGKDYGFAGDPLRAVTGTYYGYLIRAALY